MLYTGTMSAQGNPEPDLKSLHLWEQHRDYTEWDLISHPDFDETIHNLRFDKLKQQAIHSISKGYEMDVYIVRIRYANDTYTQHQFPRRKWAKSFIKLAKTLQVNINKLTL